jgi:stress response protein YsnF
MGITARLCTARPTTTARDGPVDDLTPLLLRRRGGDVLDRDGALLGQLEEIYLDDITDAPKWALVRPGGSAAGFVPLIGAELTDDELRVGFAAERVASAPLVEDESHVTVAEEEALYRHYGLDVGADAADATAPRSEVERDERPSEPRGAMTRSEEELRVEKTQRVSGRARLRKHIVTEHVTVTVPVQREEVRLEHVPAEEGVTAPGGEPGVDVPESAEQGAGAHGGDGSGGRGTVPTPDAPSEMHLHAEEIVVEKRVVPKERVRLTKDVRTAEERVGDEVRKEQIEVERDTP